MKLPSWLKKGPSRPQKPALPPVDNPYRPIYRSPRRVEDIVPQKEKKDAGSGG